ncbi:MAG TPA: NAD(P)-dependent oxidoreductase [Stellaceae bacterium]|nr:NAD(P)-dependent oxidoreductase [Stellaceae bacterium]
MTVIIVGGDSTIGSAFARTLRQRGEVVVTTSRRLNDGVGSLPLDLGDSDVAAIPLPDGEVAFFCACVNGFSGCRSNPGYARRVNVDGTAMLARRLASRGTRVVLLSSTAVLDFRAPDQPSTAPANPRTLYGQLKAEAEEIFLSLGRFGSVLRLTKVLTAEMPLFAGWISALGRGEAVTAFSDLHFSPITLDDAMSALFGVRDDSSGGIYQFSGAYDISYADAAGHLAGRMGIGAARVNSELAAHHGIRAEEIPRFTSLDSSRLQAITGRAPPDPFAVLDTVYGPVIAVAGERLRSFG